MINQDWWNLFKIALAVAYGVFGLLAAFGPLAPYKDYFVLATGILAVVAGVLGVQIVKPTQLVSSIKAHRAQKAAK